MAKAENTVIIISAAILIAFLFVAGFFFFADRPDAIFNIAKTYGLIGLFIAAIIANSTILFPLAFEAFVFLFGSTPSLIGLGNTWFDSLIIGLIGGAGAAIGEMTAYMVGLFGSGAVEKIQQTQYYNLQKIKTRLERKGGMVFIFFCALVPFPFDLVGLGAGLVRYNLLKFFPAALLGKMTRYTIIALGGFFGAEIVKSIFLIG